MKILQGYLKILNAHVTSLSIGKARSKRGHTHKNHVNKSIQPGAQDQEIEITLEQQ